MATQITNFSRTGLSDFVIQRVTAVILLLYTVVVVGFLLLGDVSYTSWRGLFDQTWMQIFTLLAVLSICAHAWIGMWTVGTDYIQEHYFGSKADAVRFLYEVISIIALVVYLLWCVKILWGN